MRLRNVFALEYITSETEFTGTESTIYLMLEIQSILRLSLVSIHDIGSHLRTQIHQQFSKFRFSS